MSILSNILSPGLSALQTVMGDPFEVPSQRRPGGIAYLGTFSAELVDFAFQEIGQREKVTRTVCTAKDQFRTKPDVAQKPALIAFGSDYVISAVTEDQLNYVFSLEKRT